MRFLACALLIGCNAVSAVDMARNAQLDMAGAASDMAQHVAADLGAPLGSACATSQACVGDYGQGRCVGGVCVAAIYIDGRMNYCRALVPDDCCLSDAANANAGVEVSGVYASEFGATSDAGACDFGAFAPWGDKAR